MYSKTATKSIKMPNGSTAGQSLKFDFELDKGKGKKLSGVTIYQNDNSNGYPLRVMISDSEKTNVYHNRTNINHYRVMPGKLVKDWVLNMDVENHGQSISIHVSPMIDLTADLYFDVIFFLK